MDRIEEKLAKVQRRLITQPRVEFDQQVGSFADPLTAIMQAVLDTAMQQFPQRRYADHARNMAVLDCFCEMLAAQFGQVSDLRATAQRREKAGREFERVMQRQDRQYAVTRVHIEDR